MKLLTALLLTSQLAFAASPADMNACVQSYLPYKTAKFNVESVGRAPNNNLIFKNSFADEHGISIFHKGAFWYANLDGLSDYFGAARTARATVGGDAFCLTFNLNVVFRDKYTLAPYNSKCKNSMELNFQQNARYDSAALLAKRLKGDIDLGQFCFAYIVTDHDFNCSASEQQEDFRRLKKWNTAACKKLADPGIDKMIVRHERLLREYPLHRNGAVPAAAPAQSPQLNHITN